MKKVSKTFFSLILILFITCSVFLASSKSSFVVEASGNNTVTFDYNISRIKNYVSEDLYAPLNKPYFTTSNNGFAKDKDASIQAIKNLRDYYKFNWEVNGTILSVDDVSSYPITSSTVFVGKWTPVNYQITYYYSTEAEKQEIKNIKYNEIYNCEMGIDYYIPVRPNYHFVDWYSTYNYEYSSVEIGTPVGNFGDKRLYAKWSPINFEINYHTDAYNSFNPTFYNVEDEDIILSNPNKDGHIFQGWYKDENYQIPVSKISTEIGGTIDLYPKWELEKYNVTFILPNGTKSTIVADYGSALSVPLFDKGLFDIVSTDVDIDNVTSDMVVRVSTTNIWYVYLMLLLLIVGIIMFVAIMSKRRKERLRQLRHMYQSNLSKHRVRGIRK